MQGAENIAYNVVGMTSDNSVCKCAKQLSSGVTPQDHMAHEHLGPRLPAEHGDAGCNAHAHLPCRPVPILNV